MTDWLGALDRTAPDVAAAWRGIEAERFISVRREVRRRAGLGSAERVLAQLDSTAAALMAAVARLPDEAFVLPGGEGDWNVAEAVGHVAEARAGLTLAAALAAGGRWPDDAPTVVPGIPGPAADDRDALVRMIARSQKLVARAAGRVAGHESDPCPLDHPQVGRLRCGEWLLFAGVHDLMHLEQLHGIEARFATLTTPAVVG